MLRAVRLLIASLLLLPALPAANSDTPMDTVTAPAPESAPVDPTADAAEPTEPLSARYTRADVATARTSIYIGAVTLRMPPFERTGSTFSSTYAARVVPLFFYNEKGSITIDLTDADLRRLEAGERVYFTGGAESAAGEPRRVEGHADPLDAASGKIKVRVWVSKNIELIFNTTYQFTGDAGVAAGDERARATNDAG